MHINYRCWLHYHQLGVLTRPPRRAEQNYLKGKRTAQAVTCLLCLPNQVGICTLLKKSALIPSRQTARLTSCIAHLRSRVCGPIQKVAFIMTDASPPFWMLLITMI